MKTKWTKRILLTIALVLCLGSTITVSAEEGTPIPFEKFDVDYYASNNPDVVEVFGLDETALYDHYIKNGFMEGRQAREKLPTRLDYLKMNTFDYYQYALENPDLYALYGYDVRKLWAHYSTIGYKEGRPVHGIYEKTNAYLKCFDIVESIINDSMSDREKAKAIHDWLCRNVSYDHKFQSHSYTIVGPILYGDSVCNGYSLAFNEMAKIAGIESERVVGVVDNTEIVADHAWNKVFIDGKWSYIDVTWDDFTEKHNYISYGCFMIDETEMNRIHNGCRAHFINGVFAGYY